MGGGVLPGWHRRLKLPTQCSNASAGQAGEEVAAPAALGQGAGAWASREWLDVKKSNCAAR